MAMSDAEFDEFLESANSELRQKQEALSSQFGLGAFQRWSFDQTTERLQFYDRSDGLRVAADVADIDSYSEQSSTWLWAWANSSVTDSLRRRAETLKALESLTGLAIFSRANAFKIEDEAMAWELAALAVKHMDALGCYRAPSSRPGGPKSYLAITEIWKVD